jgi:hypothetical protein
MLKRAIMLVSVVLLLFVGLAVPARAEEPQGSEVVAELWDGPVVDGTYTVKCNIKFYDWRCTKVFIIKEAQWIIKQEYDPETKWDPKIMCTFTLKGIPDGWSLPELWHLDSPKGYVGPFLRNPQGRITNQPRLSQGGDDGYFCEYSKDPSPGAGYYITWVINAKVKWDSKNNRVKSIKGSIYGWGEFGYPPIGWYPRPIEPGNGPMLAIPPLGQFEGKFTATPVLD